MRAFVIAIALCVSVTAVVAQPKPPIDRREQVKKKIRAMRAYTLTEELQLDQATAGKLFPLLAAYDDELDKLVAGRVAARKRLVEAGGLADTRAVDHAIDDAIANEKGVRSVEDRRVADFRKILTPQQVAKILVVLPAFDRKIQNQLARVIRQQANGGKRQGPQQQQPLPPDFDDDDLDDDAPMAGPQPPPPPQKAPPVAANTAVVDVSAQPVAHVFLDGADTGKTTPVRLTISPGKHKIMFAVGEDRYTWPVNAVAGQVVTFHKDLR